MNSHVNIWQSAFMRYFTSQQHHRWFRSRAASSVLVNMMALLIVALERHWQTINWLFPSFVKYSAYHSQICLVIIALLSWNVLDYSIRYLHCSYKLSCKFVVSSEEEKLNLSRSFHGAGATSPSFVTVKRSSSPQRSPSTPPSLLLPSSSPCIAGSSSSPLFNSVYLPSATPASARLLHRQLSSGGAGTQQQSPLLPSSVRCSNDSRVGNVGDEGFAPSRRRQHHQTFASFGGSSSGSGDLSVYFSPPRNLSALSASLLLGSGGSHHSSLQHHHQSAHLDDFSYLSRLRYQLGTPSPSRARSRTSTASPYPAESVLSLMSPSDAEPSQQHQQQQQQISQQQVQQWTRLSAEQTTRLLGIDRELACTPRGLDRWLQGIRAWLHGTIVEPLSRDVDRTNARLREAGASSEMLIGQASLAQLQAATASANAAAAAPWTRTLVPLLPYLQACEDQGYIVRRLAELASLPCLGAYRWDSGSPDCWIAERHPPDARLLMLLLSAYLDRCLPPLPGNQRPFSSVFLASASSAPTASTVDHHRQPHQFQQQLSSTVGSAAPTATQAVAGKTNSSATGLAPASATSSAIAAASAGVELRIFPASRQPPHYQLLLLGQQQQQQLTLMDIAPGSRNFFYSVLFFFYYYHSRRGGRLRQLSLGEHGLNLDWIFSGQGSAGLEIEDLLINSG